MMFITIFTQQQIIQIFLFIIISNYGNLFFLQISVLVFRDSL